MIDNELLKKLDIIAYKNHGICGGNALPSEIMRTDRSPYRIYFRFVSALYLMHEKGVLGTNELKKIKSAFMQDLECYSLLSNVAVQTLKEYRRLDAAMTACNKNKDNCEFCRGIYDAQISHPADEPDIGIIKYGGEK